MKRLTALLCALLLLLPTAAAYSAPAEATEHQRDSMKTLYDLNIADGELLGSAEAVFSRARMFGMLCRIFSGGELTEPDGYYYTVLERSGLCPDAGETPEELRGAAGYCVLNKIIVPAADGLLRPNDKATYSELAEALLRLCGVEESELKGSYPLIRIAYQGSKIQLFKMLPTNRFDEPVPVGDAAVMICNALSAAVNGTSAIKECYGLEYASEASVSGFVTAYDDGIVTLDTGSEKLTFPGGEELVGRYAERSENGFGTELRVLAPACGMQTVSTAANEVGSLTANGKSAQVSLGDESAVFDIESYAGLPLYLFTDNTHRADGVYRLYQLGGLLAGRGDAPVQVRWCEHGVCVICPQIYDITVTSSLTEQGLLLNGERFTAGEALLCVPEGTEVGVSIDRATMTAELSRMPRLYHTALSTPFAGAYMFISSVQRIPASGGDMLLLKGLENGAEAVHLLRAEYAGGAMPGAVVRIENSPLRYGKEDYLYSAGGGCALTGLYRYLPLSESERRFEAAGSVYALAEDCETVCVDLTGEGSFELHEITVLSGAAYLNARAVRYSVAFATDASGEVSALYIFREFA